MFLFSSDASSAGRILSPISISLTYLVGASIWIYGSDRLLLLFVGNELDVTFAQTLKGWAFILGTSLLLYVLLRRWQDVILASQDDLRRKKLRYEALIEASPTPILALDTEGRVITWSPAAEATLGWSEADVLGEPPPHVPSDRRDEFQMLLDRVRAGTAFHGVETRRLRRDGTWIDVSLSAAPFGNGSVRGIEVTLVDITDRKQYERGLVEAKEQAEQMSRLKSSFLANMSHEIRTPLTAIMGFANLIREATKGRIQKNAQHIYTSSERLLETLGSVLDLAKFESGAAMLHPETFDVRELVQTTVERYKRQARQQDLALQFEGPPAPIPVHLDPDAVERVLVNLVSNALKFTREGSVTVALRRSNDHAELRVSDTGVGIAEDALTSIFDAFCQESSGYSRKFEGSGLGLTIAKHLVDRMEGTIRVASEKGKGTTCTVRLPTEAPSLLSSSDDASAHDTPDSEDVTALDRLLLVEDNPANQQLVRALIGEEQTIDVVSNGHAALRQARATQYDAVLLDISLGMGLSGNDVLNELRQLPGYEKTAIIALTAHAMPGDQERFLETGFDGYLGKPFSRTQLREALWLAACVKRARHTSKQSARTVPIDEVLTQCHQHGVIDRYRLTNEALTLTREGVAFHLSRSEAPSVLQLLMTSTRTP